MIDCGALRASADFDGTRTSVFVGISFTRKLVLILGSMYGGEMKKAIFTVMNYLMPQRNVLPMHCSANMGEAGDVALFFGLSGTGKTTFSADPSRRLIGDDEHGWSDHSIFNFEGGCYAKTIHLSEESEPQIYNAIKFGSILENVVIDPQTRAIDYDSDFLTENTRATYPIEHIPNAVLGGVGDHPRNVFFLTCDAFGVLPPIAQAHARDGQLPLPLGLHEQGRRHRGRHRRAASDLLDLLRGAVHAAATRRRYAEMLAERLRWHETDCWLVNTGWTGGPYGVGEPHEHRPDAGAAHGGAERDAGQVGLHAAPGLQGARAAPLRLRRRRRARPARELGRQGRLRRSRPASSRACSRENFAQYEEHVAPEVLAAGPDPEADASSSRPHLLVWTRSADDGARPTRRRHRERRLAEPLFAVMTASGTVPSL